MTPKRFTIYARTATIQERGSSFAMAEQIHLCKEYGISRGYDLVENLVFQEVASGASSDRVGLSTLLEAAKQKKFDVLIVRDGERLARKPELLATLISEFQDAGVLIESVVEPHGVTSEFKLFYETINQKVREIERERMTARMQAGKRIQKQRRNTLDER